VLREFARRINGLLREEDMFARYGGEEFVIMLGETDIEQAKTVAQRCLQVVRDTPFQSADVSISCTVSIGGATFSGEPSDITPTQMIRLADEKLYQAKKSGRDRFLS